MTKLIDFHIDWRLLQALLGLAHVHKLNTIATACLHYMPVSLRAHSCVQNWFFAVYRSVYLRCWWRHRNAHLAQLVLVLHSRRRLPTNNCRLISTAYVSNLGCLRQKPSSFENFGCRYSTAFASISSNRNRGSFGSEDLGPSKWYRSMWKRKSCFV